MFDVEIEAIVTACRAKPEDARSPREQCIVELAGQRDELQRRAGFPKAGNTVCIGGALGA